MSEKVQRRAPLVTDFGGYIRYLRINAGVSMKDLAEKLNVRIEKVRDIELNRCPVPTPERLRIWLRVIGASEHYNLMLSLARRTKRARKIAYVPRHEANEHIDRILDAYENGRLLSMDLALLKMIAIREGTVDTTDRNPEE